MISFKSRVGIGVFLQKRSGLKMSKYEKCRLFSAILGYDFLECAFFLFEVAQSNNIFV